MQNTDVSSYPLKVDIWGVNLSFVFQSFCVYRPKFGDTEG